FAGMSIRGPEVPAGGRNCMPFSPTCVPGGRVDPGAGGPLLPPVKVPKSFPASPDPPFAGARGPLLVLPFVGLGSVPTNPVGTGVAPVGVAGAGVAAGAGASW